MSTASKKAECSPAFHPHRKCQSAGFPALSHFLKGQFLSGSQCLRLDQAASDQQFGNLDRVECCTLAQIVRNDPHGQTVFDRDVFTDTADIGRVFASGFIRRDVATVFALIDNLAARRFAQDLAGFFR